MIVECFYIAFWIKGSPSLESPSPSPYYLSNPGLREEINLCLYQGIHYKVNETTTIGT